MNSSSKKAWPRRESALEARDAPPKETDANSAHSSPASRKPDYLQLGDGTCIPILYEDRSVLALDKPAGWMLVPHSWQRTTRNLQAAIVSSIGAGHFWARCRNLKFLRYVHRLDAETTGVLLFGKSPGAVESYGTLFESRRMEKRYLAVVSGHPKQGEWTCQLPLQADPKQVGRMQVDRRGKEAETQFKVIQAGAETTLLEARPRTGRTHQIRVHLAAAGHPVLGDALYGLVDKKARRPRPDSEFGLPLALRAVELSYHDPFTKRRVTIQAATAEFINAFGFAEAKQAGWEGR